MWLAPGKLKKLWLIYLFITFFGIFIVFYGTKLLLDKSTYLVQQKIRIRNYERKHHSRNVNLIVGHYIGTGNIFGNLSKDSLNANNFSPVNGEGENGKPVVIPARDLLRMQQLFQINRFNLLASDRISLNRSLPDYRKKKCIAKKYPQFLPTTSVIIVFHNEAWSVLLRTVWSVINRSPRENLEEILLIDDASERDFLKNPLDDYVKNLPVKTTVFRLNTRRGLVAARLLGAKHATGDTLTFLDAHCECSPGWLQPLLARVQENKRKVVCPVIDIISDDNFSYIKSFEFHLGAFNWMLHFRWYTLSTEQLQQRKHDVSEPFKTPAMAGGLFTIDREYFFEIGSYDEKMKIWGGDNLEMSFRVWQCGGEIEIAPCSHVGHLFRKSSPYTFPGGVNEILNTNLARLAMVWMDEWSNFFFKFNKIDNDFNGFNLDISDRLKLRENLKCKNFNWYLTNVWPNHFFPTKDRLFTKIIMVNENSNVFKKYKKVLKEFLAQNTGNNDENNWKELIEFFNKKTKYFFKEMSNDDEFCLAKPLATGVQNQPHGQPFVKQCHNESKMLNEFFVIKEDGVIMTDEGVCLDSPDFILKVDNMTKARMFTCNSGDRQKWKYSMDTQQIKHFNTNFCLEVSPTLRHVLQKRFENNRNTNFDVFITVCSESPLQKWMIFPFDWK